MLLDTNDGICGGIQYESRGWFTNTLCGFLMYASPVSPAVDKALVWIFLFRQISGKGQFLPDFQDQEDEKKA